MGKIENKEQYDWAVSRVEELLPLVNEDTPTYDKNSIELKLLSELVADYSEEHFAIGKPSLLMYFNCECTKWESLKNNWQRCLT